MWNIGDMVLTGENRSTRRNNCPSVTLSTTSLTLNDLGLKLGLYGEKPETDRLSHGTVKKAFDKIIFLVPHRNKSLPTTTGIQTL